MGAQNGKKVFVATITLNDNRGNRACRSFSNYAKLFSPPKNVGHHRRGKPAKQVASTMEQQEKRHELERATDHAFMYKEKQ